MAFISTFEILLKPQLPKKLTDKEPELSPLARKVLQGYFLTIANVTNELVFLSLVVTTRTPGLDPKKILTVLDTTGVDGPVSSVFEGVGGIQKSRFTFPINANDTGLFILQPDATNKKLREEANFELRGYVEISISSVSTPKTTQLLITPEHRGTFFGTDKAELGEIAYVLPLANGKSLFELSKDG
ncbi:MAG: hypothetical protein RM022_009750 [Nostoc sp. EfeVER01]|uniref:hypothetical protein n=1 Tax=unclassified Nostoc TaxID=2593658 RepID=UPI002AD53A29|nr:MULTISPECIES: hypothetical protein [unclassified Nostoc]MDZ7949378.1 hypothetical protein [Nostoc sp. EfeVER01]MDZ7995238.1 hypothetical protein [Nostoc sp. EspVER01]